MRDALKQLDALEQLKESHAHVGLAYDAFAPVDSGDGKIPDAERSRWLESLTETQISPDYRAAFARWKGSFTGEDHRFATFVLSSRLLVGHGNPSASDVGITIHHTWGVPVIPGSALKGLLAHYIDAVYGPDQPNVAPWDSHQPERAPFQGVTWDRHRLLRGPGEAYRALFGAPEAEEDQLAAARGYPAGAIAGCVHFHDALYDPDSPGADKPYADDILTVHQKTYYASSGANWPNDYDAPNPVAFLTVRPNVAFQLVLTGPPEWTELADKLLRAALASWGVGGKTAAGYGVGTVKGRPATRIQEASRNPIVEEFAGWLDATPVKQVADRIEAEWFERLNALDELPRTAAVKRLCKKLKSGKLKSRITDVLRRLGVQDP